MRKIFTLALLSAVALATAMGCSSKKKSTTSGTAGDGGTGAEGGGGTGGSAGTSMTTTGSSTTTTTTSLDCSNALNMPNDCGLCIEGKCCKELLDCQGDTECNTCITDPMADPTTCNANALVTGLVGCQQGSCTMECTTPTCNPVINEGCDAAGGEACDLSMSGYSCFPPPNDAKLCAACDNSAGPFCVAGAHCIGTQCAHYCCDDGDCGTGTCSKDITMDPVVGVCVDKADPTKAACDAPDISPSGGKCYMP